VFTGHPCRLSGNIVKENRDIGRLRFGRYDRPPCDRTVSLDTRVTSRTLFSYLNSMNLVPYEFIGVYIF
jgi:hypothetical protein